MPITTADFASQIKAKYPAYKDWSDDDLTNAVLEKYPQYHEWFAPAPMEGSLAQEGRMGPGKGYDPGGPDSFATRHPLLQGGKDALSAVGTGMGALKGGVDTITQFLGEETPFQGIHSPQLDPSQSDELAATSKLSLNPEGDVTAPPFQEEVTQNFPGATQTLGRTAASSIMGPAAYLIPDKTAMSVGQPLAEGAMGMGADPTMYMAFHELPGLLSKGAALYFGATGAIDGISAMGDSYQKAKGGDYNGALSSLIKAGISGTMALMMVGQFKQGRSVKDVLLDAPTQTKSIEEQMDQVMGKMRGKMIPLPKGVGIEDQLGQIQTDRGRVAYTPGDLAAVGGPPGIEGSFGGIRGKRPFGTEDLTRIAGSPSVEDQFGKVKEPYTFNDLGGSVPSGKELASQVGRDTVDLDGLFDDEPKKSPEPSPKAAEEAKAALIADHGQSPEDVGAMSAKTAVQTLALLEKKITPLAPGKGRPIVEGAPALAAGPPPPTEAPPVPVPVPKAKGKVMKAPRPSTTYHEDPQVDQMIRESLPGVADALENSKHVQGGIRDDGSGQHYGSQNGVRESLGLGGMDRSAKEIAAAIRRDKGNRVEMEVADRLGKQIEDHLEEKKRTERMGGGEEEIPFDVPEVPKEEIPPIDEEPAKPSSREEIINSNHNGIREAVAHLDEPRHLTKPIKGEGAGWITLFDDKSLPFESVTDEGFKVPGQGVVPFDYINTLTNRFGEEIFKKDMSYLKMLNGPAKGSAEWMKNPERGALMIGPTKRQVAAAAKKKAGKSPTERILDMAYEGRRNLILPVTVFGKKVTSDVIQQGEHIPLRGVSGAIDQSGLRHTFEKVMGARGSARVDRRIADMGEHVKALFDPETGKAAIDASLAGWNETTYVVNKHSMDTQIPGPWGKAIRVPQRALSIPTNFAMELTRRTEQRVWASNVVKNKGLTGAKAESAIERLSHLPLDRLPPDVQHRLVDMAAEKTLLGDMGSIAKGIQAARQSLRLRWLSPFLQVGMNMIKATYQRTPLYLPEVAYKTRTGGLKGGQISDAMAKPVLWTPILVGLLAAAKAGLISGPGPADKSHQYNKQAYWGPDSFKVGETWYSAHALGHVGKLMSLAGAFVEADNERDSGKAAKMLWNAASENFDPSTLQDLGGVLALLRWDDNTFQKRLNRTTGTLLSSVIIPRILSKIAEGADTNEEGRLLARKTDIPEDPFWMGPVRYLQRDIPGEREKLPLLRGVTGKPITRDASFPGENLINPFPHQTDLGNAGVEKEFEHLTWLPKGPPSSQEEKTAVGNIKVPLTPEERNAVMDANLRATQRAQALIQDPDYLRLPAGRKKIRLERLYQQERERALRHMKGDLRGRAREMVATQDLPEEEP